MKEKKGMAEEKYEGIKIRLSKRKKRRGEK